jgi:hypothetical protein
MRYSISEFNSNETKLILTDTTNSNSEYRDVLTKGCYVKVGWLDHSCEIIDIKEMLNEIHIYIKQERNEDEILINVEDIISIDYERTEYKSKEKYFMNKNNQNVTTEIKIPKLEKLGTFKKSLSKETLDHIKLSNTESNQDNILQNKLNDIECNKETNVNSDKYITVDSRFLLALSSRLPKKNLFIELLESKLQPLKSLSSNNEIYKQSLEKLIVMIYNEIYNS